ncbi:MAG TPA: FecR domain-containing protein [Chloroflexota bacterium]|nr:FecR domain-containing protein [Chloroflexota bacterium]
MLKHDALCRALGAAWAAIFISSLLLPLGAPTSAQTADSPGLTQAQAITAAVGEEDLPAAEPPIRLTQLATAAGLAPTEAATSAAPPAGDAAAVASAPSAQAATATLEVRQGQVETSPPGSTDWAPAQSGASLSEGTRVRTLSSGSARILYSDGSRSDLSPNTGVVLWTLQQTAGGQPVVRIVQASGTTLHKVQPLTDAAARFEVETVAGTASVHGTDLGVSERRTPAGAPREFLFQNMSTPPGGDPVEVVADPSAGSADAAAATPCPTPPPVPPGMQPPPGMPTPCPPAAAVGNMRVVILGGQEVLGTEGRGLGPVMALGRNAQLAQNLQTQVSNQAGAQQAAQLAQQMGYQAAQGAYQALPLGGPPLPPPLVGGPPPFFGGFPGAPFGGFPGFGGGAIPPFVPPVVVPPATATPVVLCATITPVPPTAIPPATATATATATPTPTGTLTPTITLTPSATPTTTPSPTATFPPFVTGSPAPLCTPGPGTVLPTATATPTRTPTPGPSPTPTPRLFGPTDVEVTHNTQGGQLGGGNDRVFVALYSANQVAFIDPTNNFVYNRVSLPAGSLPYGLAFTDVLRSVPRQTLFTANSGNGTVSAIDVATGAVVSTIALNQAGVSGAPITAAPVPIDLVAHSFGDPITRVYVTDRANNVIHVLDAIAGPSGTAVLSFVTRIAVGTAPEGIDVCVNCGGSGVDFVVVANRNSNTLSFINPINNTVSLTLTLPAGFNPTGIEVRTADPQSRLLYVTGFGTPAPAAINPSETGTGTTTAVIDTRCVFPTGPVPNCGSPIVGLLQNPPGVLGPFRAAAKALNFGSPTGTLPGNRVYVTNRGATTSLVTIFNVPQGGAPGLAPGAVIPASGPTPTPIPAAGPFPTVLPVATATAGPLPFGVDFVEDVNRAFVANFGGNSVTVIEGLVRINPDITQ